MLRYQFHCLPLTQQSNNVLMPLLEFFKHVEVYHLHMVDNIHDVRIGQPIKNFLLVKYIACEQKIVS